MKARVRIIEKDAESLVKICDELLRAEWRLWAAQCTMMSLQAAMVIIIV